MADLTGKTVGQYQIVELVQDTGATQIYKGFQPNMNRYVAVNVLKSQDSAAVQNFRQQNELLAQNQHPNILPIYDSGQVDGQDYRVMRYAEGGVLQDHLTGYYDPQKAARLLTGIATGLDQIHAHGLVHGNLQPGNIYLGEAGQPMLTDFGLPNAAGTTITAYMSPEQAQGGVVDKRTDVYALGVLLYVLMTDETPHAGMVVSPRAKRPDLPEAVEKVIFKAMAQNPDSRYQNANEFQHVLIAALQPVVPAQVPQAFQPAPPPARRATNWTAILLGIILVVIICGGIFLVFNWWGNRPVDAVPGEPVEPPVEIVPTEVPEEPEQPVEPPDEAQPQDDSSGEQPLSGSDGGAQPIELPAVCSSGGFAGGFFILGSILMIQKQSNRERIKHS